MCDCIEKMDADLKKIGQQLKLVELVYVNAPIGKLTTMAIPIMTKSIKTGKRIKRHAMWGNYCPFCGVEAR